MFHIFFYTLAYTANKTSVVIALTASDKNIKAKDGIIYQPDTKFLSGSSNKVDYSDEPGFKLTNIRYTNDQLLFKH